MQHDGMPCDVLVESEECKKDACDQECKLGEWTAWYPCTKVCNKGLHEKFRNVVKEKIGNGACAAKKDDTRYKREECNPQNCTGDERCTAKMDLVIAIDGSGSLSQKGFGILQNFTVELIKI